MSLVRTRIADLEAKSGTSSEHSATSRSNYSPASSARSKIPAAYHRDRLQQAPPPRDYTPPISVQNGPDDENRNTGNLSDAGSTQTLLLESSAEPSTAATNKQQRERNDSMIRNLAGGYYSKPRQQRGVHDNGGGGDASRVAAAVATVQRLEAENRSMARKIAHLEEALEASRGRITHLISSSAKAAESASRRRRENEAAAAMKEAYARRVCQLEDTLAQAEKRASWLQGELEVVWACGSQRVGELECELELARQQQQQQPSAAGAGAEAGENHLSIENDSPTDNGSTENGSTDTSGGSSLSGESSGGGISGQGAVVEPVDGLNKVRGTQHASANLFLEYLIE